MVWVLEYLDDLEADFRAIYGVEEMMKLESPTFFRLAERLPAYQGVLQARLAKELEVGSATSGETSPAHRRSPGANHPAAQRVNLLNQGGAIATTTLDSPSYLHELLKSRTN